MTDAHLTPDGSVDRRFRGSKDLLGLQPTMAELRTDSIDGIEYNYKREPQCKVCNTDPDVTRLIDTLLLYPKTYRQVLEDVTPLMDAKGIPYHERPSYMSIRSHQKKHLPFDKLAARQIAERRAAERGRAILDGTERLLTLEAVLELVAQRGWQALVDRRITPSVAETMAAASRLDSVEKASEGSLSLTGLLAQMNAILTAVREEVPEEYWLRIVERLRQAREAQALPIETSVVGAFSEDVEAGSSLPFPTSDR